MLKYSKDFINVLSRISYNPIAQFILNIQSVENINYSHNYIDTSDTNSMVSFTPSDKVEHIIKSLPKTYITTEIRNLTHSNSNDKIFKLLQYDKSIVEYWVPQPGTVVTVLKECISQKSGKTYALVQEVLTKKLSVYNRKFLQLSDDTSIVFTKNRNNIKVGRLVNTMLKQSGFEYTAKDIEDFVNLYKSSYDFTNNGGSQFDIVSGDDISKWYNGDNYQDGGGTLNNSCMCRKPSHFFEIYTKNSKCSMVILYSDGGQLKDGKYLSNKIRGRALLWDATIDDKPVKFMDRVYTSNDSDTKLFEEWAKENGWFYKVGQSMYPSNEISNGVDSGYYKIKVELDENNIETFPYMDTLCFYLESGYITNCENKSHEREFRTTHGGYYLINEDGEREEIYSEEECCDGEEEVLNEVDDVEVNQTWELEELTEI